MPLANVNKATVDAHLTGVIVKNDINRMLARVVIKTGLLKQWYHIISLLVPWVRVTTLTY